MKILALAPMYNEENRIAEVLARFPKGVVDEVLIIDDASTDDSVTRLRPFGATLLSMEQRSGPGTAIRKGLMESGAADGAAVRL